MLDLPKLKVVKASLCEACQKCKQTRASFKPKKCVSTSRALEFLHMDLFGPSRIMSLRGNYYALVIIDDYSRFTWTLFLTNISGAFHAFKFEIVLYGSTTKNHMKRKNQEVFYGCNGA